VNLAQGLAEEWAEDGIRVNAVSPERTDTPMRRKAFPEESRAALLQPDEVARATIGLISSPLTGQVLDVRRGELAGEPEAGAATASAPGAVGAGRRPAREP
jgi:2-C-methyl-D-erythritol 4-phosphate cytidylyltransferase